MTRNLRITLAAAGFAGLMVIPGVALAAGPTGDCAGAAGPSSPRGAVADVPDPTGKAPYVYSSGGDPTSGAGFIGVSGGHGYLELGGNANTLTGGVSGSNSDTGLNGTASGSGVCVNGNSAP